MNNPRIRLWFGRLGLVIAIIGLLAASVRTGAAQVTPKTLVLGVVSGVNSPTANGVALAVARFNARGNTVTPDGTAYTLSLAAQDANTAAEVTSAITTLKAANAAVIFGPDREDLAQASATTMLSVGVPILTAATTSAVATGGNLFRTRADDTRLMNILGQYLTTDLGKTRVALFQGDPSVAQRVTLMTTALGKSGKPPVTTVLQVAGGALTDSAKVLVGAQPDAIVAFGADDQGAQMLRELRGQGYNGIYVFPNAEHRAFIDALPPDLRSGIIGVTNWSYALPTQVSGEFVRDYVGLFGVAPTAESAAAYDAAGAAIISIARNGLAPDAIQRGLLALPKVESIMGHYNATIGSNGLSADVTVFTTGQYGAPVVSARADETGRLAFNGAVLPPLPPAATDIPPTSLLPPTAAGPQPVTATVKNSTLNVRRGPGINYDIIGKLRKDDVVPISGVSPDGLWLVVNFTGQQGWITANLVIISGNLATVPIIEPPPSPTPLPATLTPTTQPFPDIIGLSAVFNPPTPKSGQPFTVTVAIRNQGTTDAGGFAVAATFLPSNAFASAHVPGLAAGQATTVNLTATVTGPGTFTIAIVLDLNKEVNEGPGEANNNFNVTYTVIP